jgi:hypothetical protein
MSDFLFFVTASVGMTLIIARGDIFKELRDWLTSFAPQQIIPTHESTTQTDEQGVPIEPPPTPKLTALQYMFRKIIMAIHCCQCVGFWCGVLCGIWYVYATVGDVSTVAGLAKLFFCGCIGSVASLVADIMLEYLYRRR